MAACYKATTEVYDEIATKNEKFKKIYEPWKKFRGDEVEWFAVAENRFDNFMIAAAADVARRSDGYAAALDATRDGAPGAGIAAGAPFCFGRGVATRRALLLRFGRLFLRPAPCRAPLSPPPIERSSALRASSCSSAAPPDVAAGRGFLDRDLDLDVLDVDLRLRREAAGDDVRECDDQRDHQDLDQHERDRAPVDLARWSPAPSCAPVRRSTNSFAGATLRR